MEPSGGADEARSAHFQYYFGESERGRTFHSTSNEKSEMDRLAKEYDNTHSALNWALETGEEVERTLSFVAILSRFWEVRGHLQLGEEYLEGALRLSGVESFPELQAEVLHRAGVLSMLQAKYPTSKRYEQESVAIANRIGSDPILANALHGLGNVYFFDQNYQEAKLNYEQSLSLRLKLKENRGIASSYHALGNVAMRFNLPEDARQFFEGALTIRRHENDTVAIANTLGALGQLARSEGKLDRAESLIREALAIFVDLNTPWVVTICINDFILIAMEKREFSRAAIMA